MRPTLVLVGGLLLVGCAMMGGTGERGPRARADLRDARGQTVGTATMTEQGGKVRLLVEARGLTPGQHGNHVHAEGRCEPLGFPTAGGHFNPLGARHGLDAPGGPHAGDLPNL
ncbi:MAG: superoxide dismutase family protein, partial [Candidatus Rokuibacteriota bacterium]